MTLDLCAGDQVLGTYTFSGWHLSGEVVTEIKITEDTENLELTGEWTYEPKEERSITITYEWILEEKEEGTLPSGVTISNIVLKGGIQAFDLSGESEEEISCPEGEEVLVTGEEPAYYTVDEDFEEGAEFVALDEEGHEIGTCTFLGWKIDNEGDVRKGEIELYNDTTFVGVMLFTANTHTLSYQFIFPWNAITGTDGNAQYFMGSEGKDDGVTIPANTTLSGVTADNTPTTITLARGGCLLFGSVGNYTSNVGYRDLSVPTDNNAYHESDTCTIDGTYKKGDIVIVAAKQTIGRGDVYVPVGTLTFSGWFNLMTQIPFESDDLTMLMPNDDVTITGEWTFTGAQECKIQYEWRLYEEDENGEAIYGNTVFENNVNPDENSNLIYLGDNAVTLPNGVELAGGYYEGNIEKPTVDSKWYQGADYPLDTTFTEGTKVYVLDSDDNKNELVGTYIFRGWKIEKGATGSIENAQELTPDELQNGIRLPGGTVNIYGIWEYQPEATADVIAGTGRAYVYVNDTIHNNDWFRYYVLGLDEDEYSKVNIRVVTYLADGSAKRAYGYKAEEDCPTLADAIQKADLVYLNTDGVYTNEEGSVESFSGRLSADNAKALLARACNAERKSRLAVILDGSVRNNTVDDNVKKVRTILLQEDIGEAYQSLDGDTITYDSAYTATGWQILAAQVDDAVKNNGNFVHDNIYCVSDRRADFRNTTYSDERFSAVNKELMPALANADFENRFTDNVTDAGFAEVYQAIQKENYERARNGGQASLDEYVMPATAVAYILNYRDYDPIIYKDQIRVLELEPCRDYRYYYDELDHPSAEEELAKKKAFATDWAQDFLAKLDADPNAITIDGMTTSEFCGKIMDIYEEYDVIYIGSNNRLLKQQTDEGALRWMPGTYSGTVSRRKQNDERTLYTYHDGNWYESKAVSAEQQEYLLENGPTIDISDGWCWKWDSNTRTWTKLTTWDGDAPTWDVWGGNYHYNPQTGKWYEKRYDFGEEVLLPNGIPEEFFLDGNNADDSTWRWRVAGGDWINGQYLTHEAGWYHKVYAPAVTYTVYADSNMDGMLYTHVGDKMSGIYASDYTGHLENESAYGFRSSGNDILDTQVEELIDYLKGGSLVILSSDFMTQNENGKDVINSSDMTYPTAHGAGHGILDTSSYVYQFVRSCFEREADGSDVPRYANLIVEDYGNGELKDTEAFVEALNQQKVTLNLYAMPTPYGYEECAVSSTSGTIVNKWNGQNETYNRDYDHAVTRIDEDTRSMLQAESDGRYYLNYEFMIGNLSAVAPLTTRYHVQLFLDSNSDGIYNTASEELSDITVINAQTGEVLERVNGRYQLQMNVPYRVRRELPDGYVGCIGWKLMVTQNGNEHIHDSVTGLTAVAVQPGYSDEVNPATGKKIIHVLQITPNDYGNKMDLEIQTDLSKAAEGNGNFDEEWYELLTNLPDFEIDFDAIYYEAFAWSFLRPGETGYKSEYDNGGVDGKLTGLNGRTDYLNLYQYDMVIVGFQDCVPAIPSQKAVEALQRYADTGKSMLFTHDTTYSGGFGNGPSNFTYTGGLGQSFSMNIRDLCGMDRYGVSVDWYSYDAEGRAQDNRSGSPIRTPGAQASAYNASSAAYQWYASHPGGTSRDVAYAPGTNQTMMAAQTQGLTWSLTADEFKRMFNWHGRGGTITPNKNRHNPDANALTEVTQVNSGIITQYPYEISPRIYVGTTHAQYYQLDLDTDWDGDERGDVVCWYAIASLDPGDWNDIYDFSPNDVRNNYYIYNKGNITYTGVGHSTQKITLDEKKLFINTFVAAYNAGIRNPSVRIVEDGSVNAPDLENASIPFNGVDAATAGTYRVYYQVKDNNITQGTRNLSVKYYIGGEPVEGDMANSTASSVNYRTESGIPATLLPNRITEDDGGLITYSADTGLPVRYDQVRSGYSYYVDVPLNRLLGSESFDFYVEVDLTVTDDRTLEERLAASDVDKLTIAKLKMFSLD
ncbi:MAG: DUF5057 domain-containing protein [bacterium]|nr:DUF5057 domain-containing protein [bacterium]